MHYLKNLYIKNLKYDLLNKFFYKKIQKLPKIKKIILNFGCKTTNIKVLANHLLALELITDKKGFLKKAKRLNLTFKIKKGNPVGCICTLTKKSKLNFVATILTEIFTKIKQLNKLKCNKSCFSYTIKNCLNFNCSKNHYYVFNNLSNLNFTIITNSLKKQETLFILKSLQLPLK